MASVLFLGPAGVGKGTYASKIAPLLGLCHLSAGSLLRTEISNKSPIGLDIEHTLHSGRLVPSNIVIEIIESNVRDAAKNGFKGYILDGFPRNMSQAKDWFHSFNFERKHLAINLTLNREILLKKISSRRVCSNCGENYNLADIRVGLYDMPALLPRQADICDKCGGGLIIRSDDCPEIIKSRLALHDETEAELIDFLKMTKTKVVNYEVFTGIKQLNDLKNVIEKALNQMSENPERQNC
jgi:adenylate kinase